MILSSFANLLLIQFIIISERFITSSQLTYNYTDNKENKIKQLTSTYNTPSENNEINNTFKLLAEGDEKIVLSEQHKDVTLVLGNTGSGKSTFIQWIAGDNSKLISKEVREGTGEYIIEDGDRIGSSINSKTIFPELVVDKKTNSAFYDCPGFSDTRSTSYDIASTYFIKKLADHARNVKLIITVGYPSVRKGVDRHDFIRLLRHTTDLIKDIKKFENSFAIVITKVDNKLIKKGKSYSLVPDENIKGSIADFLQKVNDDLKEKSKRTDISYEEKTFCNKAVELVNILEGKNNENYTRIGIFRRPDEPGPLSDIALVQQGKMHIETILYENLKFTETSPIDFGYTISEKSKNDVNILVEQINEKVWFSISEIVRKTQDYYRDLMVKINFRINSFVNNTEVVNAEKVEANIFSNKLNTGSRVIARLLAESKSTTSIEDLAKEIKSSFLLLEISSCDDNIHNIFEQSRFFAFLQLVSDRNLNTRPWSDLLIRIEVFLSNLKGEIEKNIYPAANKVKDKIKNFSNRIAKEMEEHYLNKMESLDINRLLIELNEGVLLMSNLTRQIYNVSSAQQLSQKISVGILSSDLSASSKIRRNLLNIFYHGKYLEFLHILNNYKLDHWSLEWIMPFDNTKKYLNESEKWYIFLEDLSTKFSEYEIQEDTNEYNVENIDDSWGVQGNLHSINITKHNFGQFLEKLKTHNMEVKELDFVKGIEVTASRLQLLNNILRALTQKIESDCSQPSKLVIKGHYVKLSDIVSADGKILDLCRNGLNFNLIDIFSLNAIYVDRDIQEIGSKLQVSFIAPKWQIKGVRKINLDGTSGVPHASKARMGYNGLPGLPGGAAGNFLGIGGEFIDGEYLTVTANGGDGGSAQHGGNGEDGDNGMSGRTYQYHGYARKYGEDSKLILLVYNSFSQRYIFYGDPGGVGKNGGSGGIGGWGGINGKIDIFKFDERSKMPSVKNIRGSVGFSGWGGIGGKGGRAGYDLEASYCYKYAFFIPVSKNWCEERHVPSKLGRAESGRNGMAAGNSVGMQLPEPIEFHNIARTVKNYKIYLRENLVDNLRRDSLMKFVSQLEGNMDILGYYDTLELMSELQDLEQQFHSLHQAVDFLPVYHSLLHRIGEYAQSPKTFEITDSYKKVLGYLYTTILSRIATLREFSMPNIIIDLTTHLDLVKQNYDSLTRLNETSNKFYIMNQYKDAYKTNIDRKIAEAKYFITNQVSPELDNIHIEIEHKIDSLINETTALEKQTERENQQLVKNKRELEKALIASWTLSGLKTFGQVVGCFVNLGSPIASVIDSTTQVAESLSLSGEDSGTTLQLPVTAVESMQRTIVVLKNQIFTRFKKLLENIFIEVNKLPEELSDTSATVKNLITSCQTAQNNSDVKKIFELENKLKQELTRKESTLKNLEGKADKNISSATAVIIRINQSIQFGSVGFDIYKKYGTNKQKFEVIDETMKQAEGEIKQLEQFDRTIYETITPMLNNMGGDLNNVSHQLSNKSQVFLDVSHWQVQGLLKDIKIQMRKYTKGFIIKNNLARCIEKLDETITILINIYDRIQNYQEVQQLAVYIAEISSPNANNISITNQTLNNAVNELEIIIRSNLVVNQYQTAVNAFKQQVFPFAHRYLNETRLTSLFQSAGNFTDLVSNAVQQVADLQSKTTTYKTAIKQSDSYTSRGWFKRDYDSAQPFFVWKNCQYRDEISKLLSGEKVVVKANILNSPFGKDVIKFSHIAIDFYSENTTLTSELNNKLNGFSVSATHMGNSYYMYDNNIYIITSDSQNIQFSFEKDAHGEPVHKNNVYEKIKSGDLMLSPYAMWEIQLMNATNYIHFQELNIYKDKVNLELVGYGSYVPRRTDISDTDIEIYYEAVETIPISALSDDYQQELPTKESDMIEFTMDCLHELNDTENRMIL